MRRAARLLPVLVCLPLLLPGAARSAEAEKQPGFVPPREKIEQPYTNDKCQKNCHGEKGFGAGGPSGEKRDLYIDLDAFSQSPHGQRGLWCLDCHPGSDPNFHPRAGYPKADCRACHSETPPAGVFPPDAAKILAARKAAPPEQKARKAEGWARTVHGKAWEEKKRGAPFCPSCHTAHAIRRSSDPLSTVNREHLPETCGICHQAQTGNADLGGTVARWSLAGHGKGDFSQLYAESQCLSCHQGEAAHGEEDLTGQSCPACHRPRERLEAGKKGFHLDVSPDAEGFGRAMRFAYDALLYGGAALLAALALIAGYVRIVRGGEKKS